MKEQILKILNEAVWAPSAENCQPWKFRILENEVEIFNLPERDAQTWGQRASFFAHGTLIENIGIISSQFGVVCNVKILPESNNPDLVAKIVFAENPSGPTQETLYPFIKTRTTNRKPFSKNKLTLEEVAGLKSVSKNQLILTEDASLIEKLAGYASVFEKILFANEASHAFFFNHITWNKQEEQEKSIGFFIDTLELPPPAKVLFPIIKHWKIMKLLNKIKFSDSISKENAKVYKACSAMGAICINNNSQKSYIQAGQAMQAAWLTAAKFGLDIQPLAGLNFLALDALFGNSGKLNTDESKNVVDALTAMQTAFGTEPGQLIAMTFRIGRGEKPTAKSSRLPLIIMQP